LQAEAVCVIVDAMSVAELPMTPNDTHRAQRR